MCVCTWPDHMSNVNRLSCRLWCWRGPSHEWAPSPYVWRSRPTRALWAPAAVREGKTAWDRWFGPRGPQPQSPPGASCCKFLPCRLTRTHVWAREIWLHLVRPKCDCTIHTCCNSVPSSFLLPPQDPKCSRVLDKRWHKHHAPKGSNWPQERRAYYCQGEYLQRRLWSRVCC